MPEGPYRDSWRSLPDSGDFSKGDKVYSLCHNCNNIIEEMHPGVQVYSLWELIDSDDSFPLPYFDGKKVFVQDCWRSRDRKPEQDAVRSLLRKMHFEIMELPANRERTDFCGPPPAPSSAAQKSPACPEALCTRSRRKIPASFPGRTGKNHERILFTVRSGKSRVLLSLLSGRSSAGRSGRCPSD